MGRLWAVIKGEWWAGGDMEYTVSNYREIMVSDEEIMPIYDFCLVLFVSLLKIRKMDFYFILYFII